MQDFLKKHTQNITVFCTAVLILAMLCSKLLLSMAIFGLFFLSIAHLFLFPENAKKMLGRYDVLLPTALWFFVVITGFYSKNTNDWLELVRIMLPFFGLPLVFFWLPPISQNQYKWLHYWLLFLVAIVCCTMNADYLLHKSKWLVALSQGQAIDPMLLWIKPIDHIRFSLLLAFSCLLSGYFLFFSPKTNRIQQVLFAFLTLLCLETLHLLSVRSGLLAFYATAILALLVWAIRQKRFLQGAGILAALFCFFYLSLKFIPSLSTKYYYTQWDIFQFKAGDLLQGSDGRRISSILLGIKIGNTNPVFGVGYGDIWSESGYQYALHASHLKPLLPHNEWVYHYAGGGIIGVLLLFGSFFAPLWFYRKNPIFTLLWLVIFWSFFTESTLSTALGVAIVGCFLGLNINVNKNV